MPHPDPAGIFASDAHRRVLGHLPTPDVEQGIHPIDLVKRMAPDVFTPEDAPAVVDILTDLGDEGYAHAAKDGSWRMTKKGLKTLTGSIKDEPPKGAPVLGPARLDAPAPLPPPKP